MPTVSSPIGQPAHTSAAFPSLEQLAADIPPVSWLWPGWIPRGMITLLCAAPGVGKSYVALDLAHRLIAGLPWPNATSQSGADTSQSGAGVSPAGAPGTPGPNVIYVDAEAAPQLLYARAVAWGMDPYRLFPMLPPDDGVPRDRVLDLNTPACRDHLLAMAAALRPALVIVDSLGSASRGAESRVAAVDALFAFLNDIAVQFQCAMLVIHHLRKRGAAAGGSLARGPRAGASLSSDDVRGSGHIVSLARSVLGLAAVQVTLDPQPNPPRRLQLLKTNLGPYPDPLGITFVPSGGDPSGIGATVLAYGPAPEPIRRCTAVESCARWLLEVLALECCPIRPGKLERPAHKAGYSRRTLFRARDLLGSRVIDTHGRHSPYNGWALAAPASRPSSRS